MKNNLQDLNDYLFAQIERLEDESLTPENLDKEVRRAAAICSVSDQIVKGAAIQLSGVKLLADHGMIKDIKPSMLPMLRSKESENGGQA